MSEKTKTEIQPELDFGTEAPKPRGSLRYTKDLDAAELAAIQAMATSGDDYDDLDFDDGLAGDGDIGAIEVEYLPADAAEVQNALAVLPAEMAGPFERARAKAKEKEKAMSLAPLAPVRHPNQDFFVADIFDAAFKSDGATMDAPIFSLATKPDLKIWKWTSADGKRAVEVAPSVYGRATLFDKDVLLYIASQLTAALNAKQPISRTVRYSVHDYLVATNRRTDGEEYQRHKLALDRLRGTSIKTNIKTGNQRIIKAFGVIDSWSVVEKDQRNEGERVTSVEVTISEWLYNAIAAHEVLTINPRYFRLRKSLERRLYEIARKHVGSKLEWKIAFSLLLTEVGSRATSKEFARMLREIIQADTIPDFHVALDGDTVSFQSKVALSNLCG